MWAGVLCGYCIQNDWASRAMSLHQILRSCSMSRAVSSVKHHITQVTQPPYSPDLAPCNYWLSPKLKSLLKGKRFQTILEIQENMMGGRTVWGPKVPPLMETGASLSYAQCFLYFVSSSINVFIFHITWLVTFWTDLVLQIISHWVLVKMQWTGVH